MCSDGLAEATNSVGEEYGESRLHELLTTLTENSPGETWQAILNSLAAFSGASELQEDLTLVVAQFGDGPNTMPS